MALATSDELVAYLRIVAGTEDSTLLQLALDGAERRVLEYTGQDALTTTTETDAYLDGTGVAGLQLPAYPVSDVAAVSVYSDRTDTDPEVLVENTDYVWNGATGIVHRIDGGVFTRGRQNVKVTYTYGESSAPADVKVVVLQVASRIYDVGMTTQGSIGGVQETYVQGAGNLTRDEKDTLRRLKL